MSKIKIDFTSIIKQEEETETFNKQAAGEMVVTNGVRRISYLEDGTIPVKMLLKDNELIIRRGVNQNNYSLLKFVPGEKEACRYLMEGRQMDLVSSTNLLEFLAKQDGSQELRIEYDLFSGLYLIGNYAVTLIFT
ncbi:DUF1934 domain-containing protein [Lactobacillus sp. ESL0791]|uniref:DUF1934 domain-containing protein n=1 Tax=Lactobacillus sp. ESL0791 TaxID=2983234 RepID=UPI0023F76B42|nr:DUF1934 domain-containing protein [Lactobacillus sp. ESL0791]MDF7639514.1 DUF1934 domain-containing protein [Lactobacillus sp. ESL0791]